MSKVATQFEKLINNDRARKKNEALAARIFHKNGPAAGKANGAGPLASRSGVKKQRVVSATAPRPAGNINNVWTHDLHGGAAAGFSGVPRGPRAASTSAAVASGPLATGSLANRISRPGEAPRKGAAGAGAGAGLVAARGQSQRRAAQVARALIREEQQQKYQQQNQNQSQKASGLSIRGIASASSEPLVVMAQNFAPGTTAADIESAMTPVGGLVSSCRILKTTPLVIAEIIFETRDGAERVIQTFNNQTADGRLLHVYPKVGQFVAPKAAGTPVAAAPPRAVAGSRNGLSNGQQNGRNNSSKNGRHVDSSSNAVLVDGSLGFDDPMDTDGLNGTSQLFTSDVVGSKPPPTGPAAGVRRARGGRGGRGRR